jgi:tripartite-type tricarboxylate transporter receptor subunit TctC
VSSYALQAGSSTSFNGSGFAKDGAGVVMTHVPYRGGGPATADMLGGQVQVFFSAVASSIEYIRTGKLRALAVTTPTRLEALPDVPTVGQFLRGYEASQWYGVGAPRNTVIQ